MSEKTKRWTPLRITAMIFAGLLPFLILVLGIGVLFNGVIITGSFFVFGLLLPALVLIGEIFTIRSKRHIALKTIICLVLLAILLFVEIFMSPFGHYIVKDSFTGEKALDTYQAETSNISILPSVSELGQPEEIEYHYFLNQEFLYFDSHSKYLICQYSEEDYSLQKNGLDELYVFQEEPLSRVGEPIFIIDDYTFRPLSFSIEQYDYYLDYPKNMIFIATNDKENEIVYMLFSDADLDYVTSMEELILEDCGWKYIR